MTASQQPEPSAPDRDSSNHEELLDAMIAAQRANGGRCPYCRSEALRFHKPDCPAAAAIRLRAAPTPIPTSYAIAAEQVSQAQQELLTDYSDLAPLPWRNLSDLVSAPLPRDFWVIGARPANGKTTFMLNLFDALVALGRSTLYIGAGSEGPPKDLRRQWAALRCRYPAHLVLENRWTELPRDAGDRVFAELQRQATECHEIAHFADAGERLTKDALVASMNYARRNSCRYVILDHIHRVRFDARADLRRELAETTRWLRDMAAKYDMVVLVAAQLHRAAADKGPLRDLIPPTMADLKETGTLEEDAVVGLLLHRTRRPGISAKDIADVVKNARPVADIVEPDTMCVRVGKHRRRGHVSDHVAFLRLTGDGALEARESPYGDGGQLPLKREREPGEDDLPF